jgi:hypothetical protein
MVVAPNRRHLSEGKVKGWHVFHVCVVCDCYKYMSGVEFAICSVTTMKCFCFCSAKKCSQSDWKNGVKVQFRTRNKRGTWRRERIFVESGRPPDLWNLKKVITQTARVEKIIRLEICIYFSVLVIIRDVAWSSDTGLTNVYLLKISARTGWKLNRVAKRVPN